MVTRRSFVLGVAALLVAAKRGVSPQPQPLPLTVSDVGESNALAQVLQQRNEVLDDMPFLPSSQQHRVSVRTGLPSVAWRPLNYGNRRK
jgi:hypothetical protein